MAINALSNGTFFLIYEQVKKGVFTNVTSHPFWYPLLSSSLARTAQTLLLFPLDYLKTLQQARHSTIRSSNKMTTALSITFKRDLLFSSTYWIMAENIKASMYEYYSPSGQSLSTPQLVSSNLLAGCVAGAVSGVLTIPLDVIKTRK